MLENICKTFDHLETNEISSAPTVIFRSGELFGAVDQQYCKPLQKVFARLQ